MPSLVSADYPGDEDSDTAAAAKQLAAALGLPGGQIPSASRHREAPGHSKTLVLNNFEPFCFSVLAAFNKNLL